MRMEQFKPLLQLILTSNIAEDWHRWEQCFRLYIITSGASENEEEVKIAILLHTIGDKHYKCITHSTLFRLKMMIYRWRTFLGLSRSTVPHRRMLYLNDICSGPMRCRQGLQWTDSSRSCLRKVKTVSLAEVKMICYKISWCLALMILFREYGLTLQRAIDIYRSMELAKYR